MRRSRLDDEIARAMGIGLGNLQVIRLGEGWCKHFSVTRGPMGTGEVERMTGLPIGGGAVRCDYAKGPPTMFGMQLAGSALAFYAHNCVGCEFREPGGSEPNLGTWADAQLEAQRRAEAEHARAKAAAEAERQTRHRRRRALFATTDAATDEILTLIDRVDSDPTDRQAAADLERLAREQPTMFPPELLAAMFDDGVDTRLAALLEAALDVYDTGGYSPADRVRAAYRALSIHLAVDRAASIVAAEAEDLPDSSEAIEALIGVAAGRDRLLGELYDPGDPTALARVFDLDPPRVLQALREGLREDEPWRRARHARASGTLLAARPSARTELVPDLLQSLAVPDDSRYGTDPHARSAAEAALGVALRQAPSEVDPVVWALWTDADGEQRAAIVAVYARAIHHRWDGEPESEPASVAAQRALAAIEDADDEVAERAGNLLESALDGLDVNLGPPVQELLDRLLAHAAATDALEGAGPSPVEDAENPVLAALEHTGRVMHLDHVQRSYAKAAGLIGRHDAPDLVARVSAAWRGPAAASSRAQDGLLVALREAAHDQESRAACLPLLSEIIASGDPAQRRMALHALADLSRRRAVQLPADVTRLILAALADIETASAAVDVVCQVDVPEEQVRWVTARLLTYAVTFVNASLRSDRVRAALRRARDLAAGTAEAAQVVEVVFTIIDQMPTTDAAEALLDRDLQEHPRWVGSAVRALQLDDRPDYGGLGEDDRERLLEIIRHRAPADVVLHADGLLATIPPRLSWRRIWGWWIAELLAGMGATEPATRAARLVVDSIPDTREQETARARAREILDAHSFEHEVANADLADLERLAVRDDGADG